jgi:hypothetical protein
MYTLLYTLFLSAALDTFSYIANVAYISFGKHEES